MKKLISMCAITSISLSFVTAFTSTFSTKEEHKDPPPQIKYESIEYSYDLSKLNFDNLEFKKEGSITFAEITNEDFSNSFKTDVAKKIFDVVDEYKVTDFQVESVKTSFNGYSKEIQNYDLNQFKNFLPNLDKNIDNIKEVKQVVRIEKHKNTYLKESYYLSMYLSAVFLDAKNNSQIEKTDKINIYGVESYRPFSSPREMQKTFNNTFKISINYVIDISHTDASFESELTIYSNIVGINILNLKYTIDTEANELKILDYIHKTKKIDYPTKLDKLSSPENKNSITIFDYKLDSNNKYSLGEGYADNNEEFVKEYFYAKITHYEEVKGEFYILIKYESL
ncbi:hypothetical protein [Spiroplasma turonicum]|uniref:Lipoprotein n=1 Tax=Spiroplasma turonicum TaxID=216946 RepID=A0A0K1P559_9MOLU|nr:hypothetical protein [Spiroplasma turonicum]AKU79418.1 hypothetical protein STURON_00172 [Spiroplasma turonicum]ALX70439.1 hypothetical protein STURO_v1c01700 [Spiroplasma turonicum]